MVATVTNNNKISFQKTDNSMNNDKKIDLLFDGNCPLCLAEKNFLEKRDIHNKIRFTDLSSPDYNPAEHGNVKFSDGMRKIRAVLPDQTVITGVEVFRETYKAIGLGWMFEITKLPYVGELADALYDFWAENRLRITGRGDLADVLRERAELLKESGTVECDEDACDLFFEADE
jgi:predicted DCC family thiol-disulfide oxidoreductase YuxK